MTRSRRPNRGRRGGDRSWYLLAVLALAIFSGAATAFVPTGAFSTVGLDRPGDLDVSIDGAGALQMSIADCMDDKGWNDMVTVTNRLNTTADVTVSLHDPADGSIKGASGGSLTVSLAQGASDTFEFKYGGSGPYPDTIGFDVSAVGTGLTADAVRSSAVSDTGDCSGATTTTPATTTSSSGSDPPTADFTYVRQNKNFVDLDGSPSSDSDGSIVSYEWDVGNDGTIDHAGQTVSKVRARSGTPIRLIVTDGDGATDSVTETV